MSLISNIRGWFGPESPKRSVDYSVGVQSGMVLEPSLAGVSVTCEKQLQVPAFYAAVRHNCDTIGSLPKRILEKQPDGGWLPLPTHPLHYLLACEPNSYQTSQQFFSFVVSQLMVYNNSITKLIRDESGQVTELVPIPFGYVQVSWDKERRKRFFHVLESSITIEETLAEDEAIFVSGLSLDSVVGISPVVLNKQSIGGMLSCIDFGASFFGKAVRMSGYLKKEGILSDQAKKNIASSFREGHGSARQAGSVAILDDGLEWVAQPTGMTPEEAQFIGTKEHAISEVSCWTKTPKSKCGSRDALTFSNQEQESISFCRDTIAPLSLQLEHEFNRKLFLPSERGKLRFEIDCNGLLRGDSKTRFANYLVATGSPIMTVAEAREQEGLPFMEGTDELKSPLTMAPNPQQQQTLLQEQTQQDLNNQKVAE
jgi:HK97 family phage portal protein